MLYKLIFVRKRNIKEKVGSIVYACACVRKQMCGK